MINIVLKPHISEKATDLKNENKYVFRVDSKLNKNEIKKMIRKMYRVDVVRVNILNMPAKSRRFRNIVSRKGAYKKAIVTLKEGQKIDLV